MLTNTDATLYSRKYDPQSRLDAWERIYLPEVWWHKSEQSSVTTDGLKTADVYTVRIPDTSVEVKKDDFIVKGNCLVKMRTVKDLEGTEYCKVTSANYNRFGGSPHIKVGGV